MSTSRIPATWQAGIFLAALTARLAFVFVQHRWGTFFAGGSLPNPDTRLYLELADRIQSGAGFVTTGPIGWKESGYPFSLGPTAWVMPGYPAFLALFQQSAGHRLVVQIVQAVLGSITCVATAWLAGRIAGARAAWIAGLASALHYELVFATTTISTESVYAFCVACMLSAFVAAAVTARARAWKFAAAGVIVGGATLVRPEAFGAGCCLAAALIAVPVASSRRVRAAHAAVFVAACLAVVLPWSARNVIQTGRFAFLGNESAYVLWLGNNPQYDRVAFDFSKFGGYSPAGLFPRLKGMAQRSESDVSDAYRAEALAYISHEPLKWIARSPHKLWNMWRPVEAGTSLRHQLAGFTVYPVLMIGAGAGVLVAWRREAAIPLWVFLAANIALHAAVTGEMRFRIPLWPALIPFFAVAVDRALQ